MDNNKYYSFDENSVPYASFNAYGDFTAMNPPQNNSTGFEHSPASLTDNAGTYAFNEITLPQPAFNTLYPMPTPYEEMIEGQYAFSQSGLWQPATNAYDFNTSISIPASTYVFDQGLPITVTNASIDQQAFEQTLTDLSSSAGPNALSGNTAFGRRTALATGSARGAPFELDESENLFGVPLRTHHPPTSRRMDCSLMCPRPGCSKSTPFKTLRLLETHIENIHDYPLLCTQPGCTYRRPFPRKGDLERHLASKHNIGRLFSCPEPGCLRQLRPFGRKDKLRQHVNTYLHGTFECQFDHCQYKFRGLLTKEDIVKHEADHVEHGPWECAIGNCEGSRSGFTEAKMKNHLSWPHCIQLPPLQSLLEEGRRTITLQDVTGLDNECYWADRKEPYLNCYWCTKNRTEPNA